MDFIFGMREGYGKSGRCRFLRDDFGRSGEGVSEVVETYGGRFGVLKAGLMVFSDWLDVGRGLGRRWGLRFIFRFLVLVGVFVCGGWEDRGG